MKQYAQESVQRYERMLSVEPWNPVPTLFAKLYRAGEEGMSQQEIVAEAQAYIVAGSDTTAISLTYLVWAVCKDDKVKGKLVKEVAELPDGYTDQDLKASPYLNQVIYETLRVYAAAPSALPREVPHVGAEIDGHWMPGGTTVCTQAYSMHRDPAIFPDPNRYDNFHVKCSRGLDYDWNRFNPSRWENPSAEMRDMWMPFGGGARDMNPDYRVIAKSLLSMETVCLGLHLAHMELRHAAARFFRTYPQARVSTAEGFCDDDMEEVIYFLMSPRNKRCLIAYQ
ncbi:Nn.00g070490.m01.CDS01 [Neocucurbitaria sp. VM-36]